MSKTIYDLELHDYLIIEETGTEKTTVTRVAGGWIYTISNVIPSDNGTMSVSSSSTFVPFHKEFRSGGEFGWA